MFRIHVERMLARDIDTVPCPAHKGEIVLQPEGERTRVTWISEGHVQVPLLGRVLDRFVERSFSRAFNALLKAVEGL